MQFSIFSAYISPDTLSTMCVLRNGENDEGEQSSAACSSASQRLKPAEKEERKNPL